MAHPGSILFIKDLDDQVILEITPNEPNLYTIIYDSGKSFTQESTRTVSQSSQTTHLKRRHPLYTMDGKIEKDLNLQEEHNLLLKIHIQSENTGRKHEATIL